MPVKPAEPVSVLDGNVSESRSFRWSGAATKRDRIYLETFSIVDY